MILELIYLPSQFTFPRTEPWIFERHIPREVGGLWLGTIKRPVYIKIHKQRRKIKADSPCYMMRQHDLYICIDTQCPRGSIVVVFRQQYSFTSRPTNLIARDEEEWHPKKKMLLCLQIMKSRDVVAGKDECVFPRRQPSSSSAVNKSFQNLIIADTAVR